MKKLSRTFFNRDAVILAQELLGKYLIKGNLIGKIVETEAYIGQDDKACHARWRKPETCFPMWGHPGFSYVYFTYGMHFMLNVSAEKKGFPAAILIRALEPIVGTKKMEKNRGVTVLKNLTSGPGKLTKAFGITKEDNNIDLTKNKKFYLAEGKKEKFEIVTTTRIGIGYAEEYTDKPWRFYIKDNPFVSVIAKN